MDPANLQWILAVMQPGAGADSCSLPAILVARHRPLITPAASTLMANVSRSFRLRPWQVWIWKDALAVPT
jgi:hypothetical protein